MKEQRNKAGRAAVAGFLVLCAAPALSGAQTPPPAPPEARHPTIVSNSQMKPVDPMDDFRGLNFSAEQKARISKIHEDSRLRMHAVATDEKLSPEQRGSMIEGLQRMERGEVYKVLTPEQQTEVRKRVRARRAAAQKEREKKKG
jgi:Spy/CpxP family protein refolding chaperone